MKVSVKKRVYRMLDATFKKLYPKLELQEHLLKISYFFYLSPDGISQYIRANRSYWFSESFFITYSSGYRLHNWNNIQSLLFELRSSIDTYLVDLLIAKSSVLKRFVGDERITAYKLIGNRYNLCAYFQENKDFVKLRETFLYTLLNSFKIFVVTQPCTPERISLSEKQ